VQKIAVERTHIFMICAYFLPPQANMKFNPAASMHMLFIELLKAELSITVIDHTKKLQLVLKKI